ncbi:hypothetical protein D3C78_1987350 [compost metagenome]
MPVLAASRICSVVDAINGTLAWNFSKPAIAVSPSRSELSKVESAVTRKFRPVELAKGSV